MTTRRTWRTGVAVMVTAVLANAGTTAAASGSAHSGPQAHYCKEVDGYRIRTCAAAVLPATQLDGSLTDRAGDGSQG